MMIGQTISHYRILEKLGEGGMGVVYKAEDTTLGRLVALKFLHSHLSASDQDRSRFVLEAKAASALNHANVCTIHAIEEHEGKLFIAMEFVEGQTLLERKQSYSLKQIVDIGAQIAEGLAAAHEQGIVHRDIKPENIMIRKDGIVQIMDFGLAKLRGVSRLTKEGSTLGTAGYMSPEQVQGRDSDHRSDIFSLGVVLYEMFTGQLPFKGVHETALLYEIVHVDTAPMSSIKPEIDPDLDSIVLECLEKDPNERTQSAKQIAIDLKRYKRESTGQRRVSRVTSVHPQLETGLRTRATVPAGPKSKAYPFAFAILLLVLGSLLWMVLKRTPVTSQVVRFSIILPNNQALSIENHPAIAISPDGSRLVYNGGGRLYQKKIDSYVLEPIAGTEDGDDPFFSPDGRWLGFFSGGKLKKVPLSGGAAVVLTDILTDRGGAWAKDGTIVFSPSGREGLFRMKEDGSDLQQLTRGDSTLNERTHRWPQALPDGKNVIFTVGLMGSPDYYEDASIWAATISTGERKLILKGASSAHYLTNGYLAYTHAGTLFAIAFDVDRLEVKGSSFPLIDNVSNDVATGAYHIACSDNGTLAYVPGGSNSNDRILALADRKGGSTPLPAPPQAYGDPRISPDGKRIAIVIQAGKGFDIWIYDITRNTMTRLTFGGSNRSPVWSPDGKRIAYSDNTSGVGKSKVSIIQADGSGLSQDIMMDFDRTYVNSWVPDGSVLIVTVPQKGMGWDLWVLPLDGSGKPRPYLSTRFDEAFASISPDGKWLAYTSNETGVSQIYVRPFPRGESKWQVSGEALFSAIWSRSGKTLYYVSPRGIIAVPITGTQTLTAGEPQVVVRDFQAPQVESSIIFDVMPGEQSILITKPKEGDKGDKQINVVLNWFDEVAKLAPEK